MPDVGGDPLPAATCDPDPSGIGDSLDNPLVATVDGITEHVDTICPRYDTDIWRASITGERQLADITVEYNKGISPIQLAINWTGPRSLCVPASPDPCPVSCSAQTPCEVGACGGDGFCVQGCAETCTTDANCTIGTCRRTCASSPSTVCTSDDDCTGACNPTGLCSPQGQCDTDRGGCRDPQAAPCTNAGQHCAATEQCALAPLDSLVTVIEPADARHRISTNLAAFAAGDYFLEVYDRGNREEDADATYTLTIGQRQDPDVNEPNNAENMATTISPGGTATGYFSYVGDVDYYRIDPGIATRPIVEVTVSWPLGTVLEPTWRIEQDGAVVPIPARTTLNQGSQRVQEATWILPAATPFYIRVDNPTPETIDLTGDSPYTVSVTVRPDPDVAENPRDDEPANATELAIGAAGNLPASATQGIRAENDVDWYHVTRTGSDNGIVRIQASTTNGTDATGNCYTNCALPDCPVCSDGFLLDVTVYYPTAVDCSSPTACNSAEACKDSLGQCNCILGECMIWVERPAPEGLPTDGYRQEEGGNAPNNISVQLPVFGSDLYILVRHLPTSILATPGFSADTEYTLNVTHIAEPDSGDQSNPDNHFITRPLMNLTRSCGDHPDNPGKSEFFARARDASSLGSTNQTDAVTGGQGFAVLGQGSQVQRGSCADLTIEGYDDMGKDASQSVDVTTTVGVLVESCASGVALSGPVILSADGTAAVGLDARDTAAIPAPTTATVTTSVSGSGVNIDQPVPIYDGAAPAQLVLDGPRYLFSGGKSGTITATLPAEAAATVYLDVAGGTDTTVSCHGDNVGGSFECRDIGDIGLSGPCIYDVGQASCQVPITATNIDYGLHMHRATNGLAIMTVTDAATTPAIIGATWVAAVYEPPTWGFTSSGTMGYISYEGDADFWTFTLPLDMPKGELTATLYYDSGNVDLRMAATRDESDGDYCPGCWSRYGCGVSVTSVGSDCAAGCTEPADHGGCFYVFENADSRVVNVWINDANQDGADETAAYQFDLSYNAGCPAACLAEENGDYICSQ